ncbi:peptidoglycan-binding protein LysM [Thalassococcus sp. S3]|nr:peptidoglycan-binding protein LysM [Thalassococcus sp. S3]
MSAPSEAPEPAPAPATDTPARPAPAPAAPPTEETTAAAPPPAEPAAPATDTETAIPEPEASEPAASRETVQADPAPPESADTAPPQEQAQDALAAPSFDVVRADPDGTTLVAGQSAPGSTVSILLDNQKQEELTADANGTFVAFLSLPVSSTPRVLTLRAALDGQTALSEADIILAPSRVAEAAPPTGEEVASTTAPEAATEPAVPSSPVASSSEPTPPASRDQIAQSEPAQGADTPAEREPAPPPPAPHSEDVAIAEPAPATPAPSASQPTEPPASEPAAPETAPVAVLRSDADGVELVQPAAPSSSAPRDRIALDTISYSADGEVLLSGRARGQSVIRVYLDNAPVADLNSSGEGRWRGQIDGIEPGIYTLRLDEIDSSGAVISRLETPFKREAPAVLAGLEQDAPPATQPIRSVTVQTGDTLWAISRDRYGDGLLYVRVFEANRSAIRDPDLIYPGQIFSIPD